MTNGNDPVYPITYKDQCEDNFKSGLTKREYFAAIALQGILSNAHLINHKLAHEIAVESADNLINELGGE